MNHFWEIIASNAILATLLAIGTVLVSRVWKNPAAIHLLWVVVLLKLFTPPIVTTHLPFAASWLPSAVSENSAAIDAHWLASTSAPPNSHSMDLSDVAATSNPHASPNKLTVASEGKSWSLSTFLAAIWILGTCCVALGYAFCIRRFASHLQNVEAPPQGISMMVTQLASNMGLSHIPKVLMTPIPLPPLVWSIGGQPRMILPTELFARLSGNAQATIIAHELAHVSRRDYLVRLLELAATTLFWWHPIVWWACSELRDLEEQCCDSRALELVPNQERTYAAALVDTLEFLSEHPRVFVPLPTAVHSTGSLSRRIRMLTQYQTNRLGVRGSMFIAAVAALPLVAAFTFGAQEVRNDITADSDTKTVAILSGRVTDEAGEPLADARVIVAIPATDMRFVDSSTNHKRLEAKTGENGEYRLEIPTIKPTNLSFDVLKPGYRKLVGTLMSGGDAKEVEVAPGVVAEASFALKPSLHLKGVVVDEQGNPVPAVKIGANANYARSSGGVERTASNSDGSFELFNYSVKPFAHGDDVAKGTVDFFHPDYVGSGIEDIYAVSQDEREALRIVLPTGYKVSGTVLDVAGNPVSNVMVEAFQEDGRGRKATMTDSNGKFALRGLTKGLTTLRAHALELNQKIKLPIDLDSDKNDVDLRLQAISLTTLPKIVAMLGMKLTDLTPELQSTYDLHDERGALILDPGKDSDRLKIGQLVEGYNLWMVGEKRIGSVREFINQILAEAAPQDTDEYSVRVVYSFRTLDFVGTNTQYLKLTKDDLEQLRKVAAQLTDN